MWHSVKSPQVHHMEKLVKAIVFEGGGVAGVAHSGVLKVLDAQGKLEDVTHWGGSSAGSIAAAACACGLTTEQMQDVKTWINDASYKVSDQVSKLGTEIKKYSANR